MKRFLSPAIPVPIFGKTQKSWFKKIFFSCVLLLATCVSSQAQWVTIPDAKFVTWLQTNIPQCMNGNDMDTTCYEVIHADYLFVEDLQIQDLTGIQYFDNLSVLLCSNNQLTQLPTLPRVLTDLICNSNQLTQLPSFPPTLITLECNENQLTQLPSLPSTLTELLCGNNQLSQLPSLPPTLKELECYGNQLTQLPSLPSTLTTLVCNLNPLGQLLSLPPILKKLGCIGNQLTQLPSLPSTLIELWCGDNQLTQLPSLPSTLKELWCYNNKLTQLPTLPSTLTKLEIHTNQLTQLPSLPALSELKCYNNQLTQLPPLPPTLTRLWCFHNQLTQLPSLPFTLTQLACSYNLLTQLPSLPSSITRFECENNQLTQLPSLPSALTHLWCENNPLSCLPELPPLLEYIELPPSIKCLSNHPPSFHSYYKTTYPLCDVFNPNGCDFFWNISGKVFFENNSNCIYDTSEALLNNVKVQLWSNGILKQQTFSTDGNYSFDTDSFGTYQVKIDTAGSPFLVACPGINSVSVPLTSTDSLKYGIDFGLKCKPGFDVAVWNISANIFRPANLTAVTISAGDLTKFSGASCAAGTSGTVQVNFTGPAKYISASGLTPSSVSGNTITWNIANFGTVNPETDFRINVRTDTTASLGSQICFTVSITPTAGDNNPVNNSLTHCFTVVGSFDPNDKQVSPVANIDSTQEWLTYTVRFQNTGTAKAQHIYIDDTLDANLEVSSFQLLSYSHDPIVQVNENAVRFNFPNINLPDSNSNEPGSHGFVQFKVKLKQNLQKGVRIENTAFIYFDFNPAIVTNTVVNIVDCHQQQIQLTKGWNTISSYIIPNDPTMETVFADVVSDIVIVKNNSGDAYIPSAPINNIGNWDHTQGYKVKTANNVTLTLGCTMANVSDTISLPQGWSMIGYWKDTPLAIDSALNSLGGDIVIVKNNEGKTYIPSFGINNIGNMQPGQGYQIKLANPGVLVYPGQ